MSRSAVITIELTNEEIRTLLDGETLEYYNEDEHVGINIKKWDGE